MLAWPADIEEAAHVGFKRRQPGVFAEAVVEGEVGGENFCQGVPLLCVQHASEAREAFTDRAIGLKLGDGLLEGGRFFAQTGYSSQWIRWLMSVRSCGLRPVVARRWTLGLPFISLNLRRTSITRS